MRAGVQQFAPSEFAAGVIAARTIDVMRPTLEVMDLCREAQKAHPDLEIAGFHIGLFINYLGLDALHYDAEAVHSVPHKWPVIWNMREMKAQIPLSP